MPVETHVPPSQQLVQGPVPKPGEPVEFPVAKPKRIGEMAKVTWLGQGDHGPDTITQWGNTFKKGEAIEIADPSVWTRAQGDPFFKVEVEAPPKAKVEPKVEPKVAPKVEPKVTMVPEDKSFPTTKK